MKKIVAILLLMLPHFSTSASVTYGAGNASCGTWLKHSEEGGSDYAFNVSWILGYLSALQVSYELEEVDVNSIKIFLDKYCYENPFDSISEATHKLTLELII
ncbi:hypothetical protein [Grimontia indica]|uniref:hypothetical protein n=1 Tax=Grimontia indica TaxID=1056512 RepID=UPI000587C7BA|nr:hypothetical protein [Grimontia indica]